MATSLWRHAASSSAGTWLDVALPGFPFCSTVSNSARDMLLSRSIRIGLCGTDLTASSAPGGCSRVVL